MEGVLLVRVDISSSSSSTPHFFLPFLLGFFVALIASPIPIRCWIGNRGRRAETHSNNVLAAALVAALVASLVVVWAAFFRG